MEVFADIPYLVHVKKEKRFYLHTYPNFDVNEMVFYYRPHKERILEIENLLKYISDENLYLLFQADQLTEIKDMMTRVYKHQYHGEPPERWNDIFYKLAYEILRYEDYQEYGKALRSYNTVCKLFLERINEFWNQAYIRTQK
jgi:hypothetical protein